MNDIPIVRYWAQAPDGKSTKHRIAAALDLVCEPVGTRSNAKRGHGGHVAQGAEWGFSKECHRSRTPASAASASHDLWDCREGTCSPANATSPCGRPVLASHDRRTSHDGILRQIRLLAGYKVFHVHVRSYSFGHTPAQSSSKCAGCHTSSPGRFWFLFRLTFCHGGSARLARPAAAFRWGTGGPARGVL